MQHSAIKYAIIAACFLFSASRWYDSASSAFIHRYDAVKLAWVQLNAAYRDHAALATSLSTLTRKFEPNSAGAAAVVASTEGNIKRLRDPAAHHKIMDPKELSNYAKSYREIAEAAAALVAMSEESLALKNDRAFKDLVARLKKSETDIAAKEARFDEKSREYNRSLERFPYSLVAKTMKLSPYATLK